MTTFAHSNVEGSHREFGGQPLPPDTDASMVNSAINGLSTQQNAVPGFAPSVIDTDHGPLDSSANNSDPVAHNPSDPVPADQLNLASSLKPNAHVETSASRESDMTRVDVPPEQPIDDIATPATKPEQDAEQLLKDPVAASKALLQPADPSILPTQASPSQDAPSTHAIASEAIPATTSTNMLDNAPSTGASVATNESPPSAQLQTAQLDPENSLPNQQQAHGDMDQEMVDATAPTKIAREREDDDAGDHEPSAKRPKTEDSNPTDLMSSSGALNPGSEMPAPTTTAEGISNSMTNGVPPSPATQTEDHGPMTELRLKRLVEGMRNIKKSKHAAAFARPVDPVALSLPKYFDYVKHPMDLGTMEQKLKDNSYATVNEYVADFDQMVQNSILFNGQAHPISQSGMSIKAQLNAQLKKLPPAGDSAPAPAPKKKRKSLPDIAGNTKRRDSSRQSLGAAQTSSTPHAPGPDGVPIIRRDSALGDRPKRKLVKPAPRDLAYAKPQKKKYRAELKFAEEVLTEMKRGRYAAFSAPFQNPVDPVALNIPNYHKVVKSPMDVSTISEKLRNNQYENLKEFENDFRQIFTNCYKFNPTGTPVNLMGKQYEDVFNQEMAKKNEKIASYAPASTAASPTADSEESEEEEEEDELDEDDRQAKIKDLTDQLQEFTQKIQSLSAGLPVKSSKSTSKKSNAKTGKNTTTSKTATKRNSGASAVSKPVKKEKTKPKAKAKKPLTNAQKEEIANRIGELPTEEIARVAEKIKASLASEGKPVPPDDELEFQIDDIPEDLLHELYVKVCKLTAPQQSKDEDDDFEVTPDPPRAGGKSKKNKPMTAREQEEQISRLQQQLNTFKPGRTQAPPPMFQAETTHESDDSASESEEE